jgi:hypothetical protein
MLSADLPTGRLSLLKITAFFGALITITPDKMQAHFWGKGAPPGGNQPRMEDHL